MTTTFVRPPTFSEHDPKSSEVHRLLAIIGDHRLDAPEGVSLAIDVFSLDVFAAAVETVDDEPEIPSRRILETFAPDRFRSLRNVGVAVKALDMLRGLT